MYKMNDRTIFIKLKSNKRESANGTKFKMTDDAFFVRMVVYFKFTFSIVIMLRYVFVCSIMILYMFIRMYCRK